MKKLRRILTTAAIAGTIFASIVPSAFAVNNEEKTRFIAFGDSNTSGSYFDSQYPNDLKNKWVNQTAATYSIGMLEDDYNAGVSGNTTNQAMKRFKTDVLDKNPSAVSIMFGLNDGLLYKGQPQVSKAQFEKNLTSMVTQLKAKKVKVLLMTNLPVNEGVYYKFHSKTNPEIRQLYVDRGGIRSWMNGYNEIIRKVAKTQKVQLVDNYANAVAKAGNATDTKLSRSGLIDPLLGFHWSPRGHGIVAYSVKHYLSK